MASKFNFIETVASKANKHETIGDYGTEVYYIKLEKVVEAAFPWYEDYTDIFFIDVFFNKESDYVRVYYSNGKRKDYAGLNKRTWNAIVETAKFNGYEL